MNEAERDQLAQRLSAMSLKETRREIYDIDPDADMKYFRNSYWDEYHTLYLLPNAQLSITLVEKADIQNTDLPDQPTPPGRTRVEIDFQYAEARVTELERPPHKRGGERRYQFR